MKNIIILLLLIITSIEAKKDFYYSFIKADEKQISEYEKQEILSGNHKLKTIERSVREGQLEDAFALMIEFKANNKLEILNAPAMILETDIMHKKGGIVNTREAIAILVDGVNNSTIQGEHLLEAYKLLVLLKLQMGKPDEAKEYAKTIGRIFNDPISQASGKIALAQILISKRQFKPAISILYKILVKTNNLNVATVVADELYDAYILDGQREKAFDLVGKVLKKNIEYYASDSYMALLKVNKLIEADMPTFAIDILKMLLDHAIERESINKFNFRLANVYMQVTKREHHYMLLAKEIYTDLLGQLKPTPYHKQVQMTLDEILMREGKITASIILNKYPQSESIEQKVLTQELLNHLKAKEFDTIQKLKLLYLKIPATITKQFGYENIEELFAIANASMIAFYLEEGKCMELADVLHIVSNDALEVLIENNTSRVQLFDCLIQVPDERTYAMAKKTFIDNKDAKLYLSLEKIAILLNKIDDAYEFVQKIDMLDDREVKSDEFLYRFLIYGKLNNNSSMEQFFNYTKKYPEFIKQNDNNPMIIDFYYQYYLYLAKNKHEKEALQILRTLEDKQREMNAFVYSPFVEFELVKIARLDELYQYSIDILQTIMKDMRYIKPNDLAHIHYEIAKLYELLKKPNRYEKSIQECKDIKKADNLYKKMCDKL